MNVHRLLVTIALTLLAAAGGAEGQTVQLQKPRADFVLAMPPAAVQVLESAPLESISVVKNAPFSAETTTEFTHVLGDGNRIERRYVSTIARDSRGRTRREEEIALIGPLGATGPAPRLVTIVDPDRGVTYTLDETTRVAHRNAGVAGKLLPSAQVFEVGATPFTLRKGVRSAETAWVGGGADAAAVALGGAGVGTVVMESLGTRTIEGIKADGTRTMSTIPAGAIGNLMPIEVMTERWFSPELQMAVLITRRDPRAGETIYRMTNIVRAEPADVLFAVPPDYEIRDGVLAAKIKQLESVGQKKSRARR